jgi:ectoine hydroxylase-related dioxygenase (phytanoyl-CoA dioxygenase family)
VHGTDVATLWLAVDDADAENAAMQIIPGSQSDHTEMEMIPSGDHQALNSKVAVTPEQEASAITLAMRAGSLSIHDSYILHSSAANQSERRRAGYTIRYCSTDTAWVDTDEHPIPVFLVRGESGSRGADYVDLRPEVKPTPAIFSKRPSAP